MIKKPSVLLLGSSGQLGKEISKNHLIRSNYSLLALDRNECDITNFEKIDEVIDKIKPAFVINCAAYTNVDKAEKEKELANQINNIAVENLSKACKKVDSTLIHFSTDYVFNSISTSPIKEKNKKDPINFYGYSKHLGEEKIFKILKKFFIFRISWVYGEYGENFPKKIIELMKKNKELNVVNDQFGSPTPTSLISSAIGKIICDNKLNKKFGVYNLSPDNYCSWFDIAEKIAKKQKKFTNGINPISSKNFKSDASRPSYSCLDNAHFKKTFKMQIEDWSFYMDDFLNGLTND